MNAAKLAFPDVQFFPLKKDAKNYFRKISRDVMPGPVLFFIFDDGDVVAGTGR